MNAKTKHTPVAIEVSELFDRLFSGTDDFDIVDALDLDILRPGDADGECERYDAEVAAWLQTHRGQFVEVSWPEHVINPRFNSDATYAMVGSRERVVADCPDAVFYGEVYGCW
jgi:hypothetical protein